MGIGTTDPSTFKLNVNGRNIRMSAELIVEGNKSTIVGSYPTVFLRHTNSSFVLSWYIVMVINCISWVLLMGVCERMLTPDVGLGDVPLDT